MTLTDAAVWREALAMPQTLAATLDAADGVAELAEQLTRPDVRRVVASGNGASWYAALALQLAALESGTGPEVLPANGGLLAAGTLRWREGDLLLAFSSSGEFRDVIDAIGAAPSPFALVTANADSTLGRAAGVRTLVDVRSQAAATHTQGYLGAIAVALAAWAQATGDRGLADAVRGAPERVAAELDAAPAWAEDVLAQLERPRAAVAFGPGPAWPAALESALMLAEIALVPAQGLDVREGATTGMYALAPGHLVLSHGDDALSVEAERVCARRGATVVRAAPSGDPRLACLTAFARPLALATLLAQQAGLDADEPAWKADYLATARR